MENSPNKESQESSPKIITPESGVNKYFEQEGKQTTLDKTEVRNRITDAENRIASDIAGLDAIRSKLGLPPATNEDIKNLPAFSQNLANLKELRAIEKQNALSSVEETMIKQDANTNEQVQTDEERAYAVFRSKLGIPSVVKEVEVASVPEKNLSESIQKIDTDVVGQLQQKDSIESVKSFSNATTQDKAPFLRDAVDLVNERAERIKNEVNPTQNIDVIQEVAQPEVSRIAERENVPEIKTEEIVSEQKSEVEKINKSENNMEPKNNHDEIVEAPQVTESIPAPVVEQSLNNNGDKEVGIESVEAEAVYVESIKNFTNSYKGFFENLLRYNESTLQKNGEESSDSILYNGDIDTITKDLDGVLGKINNKDTAKIALEHMVNINSFLMSNLFPIKSGMSSSSVEGYDFLGKSIDEIGASLVSFYGTLKATKQEGSVEEVATQLSESLGQLKDVQERKLRHLEDYLSR